MAASWQKRSSWIWSQPHGNVISVVDRSARGNSAISSMYIVAFDRRPKRRFFFFPTIAGTEALRDMRSAAYILNLDDGVFAEPMPNLDFID
jgi:hypothetical protein